MTDLPEISEACRCGSSIKLAGADLATDDRLDTWRKAHQCLTDAERTALPAGRTGAATVTGFGFTPPRKEIR